VCKKLDYESGELRLSRGSTLSLCDLGKEVNLCEFQFY
jgi:hypothetical protein